MDKLLIGKFSKGQTTNLLPFAIDNDAFPYMMNFYTWRGRIKRKRGTAPLARLQRQVSSFTLGVLDGAGNFSGNIFSLLGISASEPGASMVPGSLTLVTAGILNWAEANPPNGTITSGSGPTGTINYATGQLSIAVGALFGVAVTATFSYYPSLPVMGLENLNIVSDSYPLPLAFDTKYAYQLNQTGTNFFYSTSYYKGSNNPVVWSGADYQQFWSSNYQGSLWATNGKAGFHFKVISGITAANPCEVTTSASHNLVTGDYVFFNETTGNASSSLNGKAFAITKTAANKFTVAVDTTAGINNVGIVQTLTGSTVGQDGIKFYDGDMTGGTGIPTGTATGWVNFAPPLTSSTVSINDTPMALYYLVGARMVVPFKDRILFFGITIQTSTGSPIYLQDVVLWSWNGTAYYNALVPSGQTFDVTAYYVDQGGKGGWLAAGIEQPIISVNDNEDVLIVGFPSRQTRFVYTSNDFQPFLFYSISGQLGTSCSFSGVSLDTGVLTFGTYGIAFTNQSSCDRADLSIPDTVFDIRSGDFGVQRVNAIRDYFKEWAFFSYPYKSSSWKFPTQTLLYNYREASWGVLYENFTTHGQFWPTKNYTWATLPFRTWSEWGEAWNSGSSSKLFPNVIAGNPQGFVVIKGQGTVEAPTGAVSAIANSSGKTQITSLNHCVEVDDYLYFFGFLGTTAINGVIGKVLSTADALTFVVDIDFPAGTYIGAGTYTKLVQPFLQTKEFPFYWEQGKKVRLGVQKYLFDTTAVGQCSLYICLSQNSNDPWNDGPIVPNINSQNDSLIYSETLFTCPETDNLQMPTAQSQYQIWHRINTSLIGDTVQLGITLSDAQMRDLTISTSEIALHAIDLTVYPGPILA